MMLLIEFDSIGSLASDILVLMFESVDGCMDAHMDAGSSPILLAVDSGELK